MEEIHKRLKEVREKLKRKFIDEGLDEFQAQVRLNTIDNDFFLHLWVDGKDPFKGTSEDRLDFYIRSLELNL